MNAYPIQLGAQAWLLGNVYFNLCCIRGKNATVLIEVGISAVADAVIAQMDELGVSPDYLVVTHPHSDHLTGLDALRRRYPQTATLCAPGAVEFFTHPKAARAITFEDRQMSRRLEELGWQSPREPVADPPSAAGFQIVEDGFKLDLGGITIELTETHGHAPGSLAAWIPERKILVASDALGFHYLDGSFLPLFFTGYDAYIQTLDRLASYAPEVLCLGHQGPLTGNAATEAFNLARTAAVTLRRRISEHVGSDEALADRLFKEAYRDEMTLYSSDNIHNCVKLLIQRAQLKC